MSNNSESIGPKSANEIQRSESIDQSGAIGVTAELDYSTIDTGKVLMSVSLKQKVLNKAGKFARGVKSVGTLALLGAASVGVAEGMSIISPVAIGAGMAAAGGLAIWDGIHILYKFKSEKSKSKFDFSRIARLASVIAVSVPCMMLYTVTSVPLMSMIAYCGVFGGSCLMLSRAFKNKGLSEINQQLFAMLKGLVSAAKKGGPALVKFIKTECKKSYIFHGFVETRVAATETEKTIVMNTIQALFQTGLLSSVLSENDKKSIH